MWLMQANLNQPSQNKLILAQSQAIQPDWSPRADEIIYTAPVKGNWDIYIVASTGENLRRLTENASVDASPVWSPEGGWLAFLSNRGGNWGIWILHPTSGDLRQVYAFDGGIFTPPPGEPYGERDWWAEQLSWGN